jgi:hypothetical protein
MAAGERFNNLTDFACADTFAQSLQVFNNLPWSHHPAEMAQGFPKVKSGQNWNVK